MADAKNESKSKKTAKSDADKHPLLPPIDPVVEVYGLQVQVLESTIGVHDFKLTFIDTEHNVPVGYGWFNQRLAAQLLGQPLPDRTPERGSVPPETVRHQGYGQPDPNREPAEQT